MLARDGKWTTKVRREIIVTRENLILDEKATVFTIIRSCQDPGYCSRCEATIKHNPVHQRALRMRGFQLSQPTHSYAYKTVSWAHTPEKEPLLAQNISSLYNIYIALQKKMMRIKRFIDSQVNVMQHQINRILAHTKQM